jgi:hypothetical protein
MTRSWQNRCTVGMASSIQRASQLRQGKHRHRSAEGEAVARLHLFSKSSEKMSAHGGRPSECNCQTTTSLPTKPTAEVDQALQRQSVIDVQQKISSEAVRASENSTLIAHRLAAPRDKHQPASQNGIVNVSIISYNNGPAHIRLGSGLIICGRVSRKLMSGLKVPWAINRI